MRLTEVTVTNYRSITLANNIKLGNYTVLIGKNNEGKTNILKALELAMFIIDDCETYRRNIKISKSLYDWADDFPRRLQYLKRSNHNTSIRLYFNLNIEETKKLNELVSSSLNGKISISIEINETGHVSINLLKRGKNTKSLSEKISIICGFICENFEVQFIKAIRSEEDAYELVSDLIETEIASISDQKYTDCLSYIEILQQEKLRSLSERVKEPLKEFIPQIKEVTIALKDRFKSNRYLARKIVQMEIDDGVKTTLSSKGDGIKSLAVIAMLSQVNSLKNRLIIIDEPETHLHSGAIRYISNVLRNMSKKNQILVSTHNSIFINRSQTRANVIIDDGKAKPAINLDSIRNNLGIECADNLIYADYVLLVEGETDKKVFDTVFNTLPVLKQYISTHNLTVHAMNGTHNLRSEICSLARFCCNFLVVLDYDEAGKNGANDIKQVYEIGSDRFRYFMKDLNGECELEDMYDQSKFEDLLGKYDININNPIFKNKTLKWKVKIERICQETGRVISDEDIKKLKVDMAARISECWEEFFSERGLKILKAICDQVENELNASLKAN